MKLLNHILAATDFSDCSIYAVNRGFMIAHSTQSQYTIMHALGMGAIAPFREFLGEGGGQLAQEITEGTRSLLLELIHDPARNLGVEARAWLDEGFASAAIPAYAEAADVDLILLGTRGSSLLKRVFLGSVASKLLRLSKRPLLMTRQSPAGAYKRILIATDFSPCSERAIRLAREIAPEADVLLLHVFDVPFEGKMRYAGVNEDIIHQYQSEAREHALRQLHALAGKAGLQHGSYTALVQYGDAVAEIVAQESQHRCDLIVMGKHGTNVTEELLLGSVTKHVLGETKSDMLVVVDERMPALDESE